GTRVPAPATAEVGRRRAAARRRQRQRAPRRRWTAETDGAWRPSCVGSSGAAKCDGAETTRRQATAVESTIAMGQTPQKGRGELFSRSLESWLPLWCAATA